MHVSSAAVKKITQDDALGSDGWGSGLRRALSLGMLDMKTK